MWFILQLFTDLDQECWISSRPLYVHKPHVVYKQWVRNYTNRHGLIMYWIGVYGHFVYAISKCICCILLPFESLKYSHKFSQSGKYERGHTGCHRVSQGQRAPFINVTVKRIPTVSKSKKVRLIWQFLSACLSDKLTCVLRITKLSRLFVSPYSMEI